MPPKAEDVREEPLTAVLLADSFSKRMAPITTERPKVLLPLVNSPMIEYILEWLETSGVLVVHILACSHADLLQQYLTTSSKWADSELQIHVISSYNCLSAGEALRLVDQEQIIKDDFILVSGDVVTNMNLQEALAAHKKRRSQDKSAIMTLVAMPNADEAQRTLSGLPDLYIALDHSSHRVLSYVPVLDGAERVDLDTAFFSERDSVHVRSDLIDAGIYICAPEVLVLFSDNFDFQHIQRDFIRGVLSEEELGNKLYMHVLRNEFAAHIANFRSYATVSMDIMCRWLYPICPDTNVLPAAQPIGSEAGANNSAITDYFFLSGCRYKESMVRVDRTANIGDFTCIGSSSTIFDSACISRSVIGRSSRVGANAQISDSFIMGGVDIGAGHVVPPHTRVTLCTHLNDESDSDGETEGPTGALDADSQDEDQVYGPLPGVLQAADQVRAFGTSSVTFDAEAVGPQGAGFDYHKQQGSTVSDRDLMTSVALPPVALATQRGSLLGMPAEGPGNREADEDEALDDEGGGDPEMVFKREVVETLLRTMLLAKESESAKTSMMENAVIELNALKIADCARYVLTALMDLHSTPPPGTSAQFFSLYAPSKPDVSGQAGKAALLQGFKATLSAWRSTLKKFLQEDDDQLDLLTTLEDYCGCKGHFAQGAGSGDLYVPIFGNVLWELYDMEIITESVFLDWEKLKGEDPPEDQEFLVRAKDFLEVLHEDDSDSEEEDSESEED